MTNRFKNGLLLSCFALGQLPALFYGMDNRLWLSITHMREKTTRIDFFVMYYSNALAFLMLTWLLTYPKGVDKRIARFVLIVCYLDVLHLFLFASRGFGMTKLAIAVLVFYIYEIIKKKWKR